MESLRQLFGLRDEDETISVMLVLFITFLVVLFFMRGCFAGPTGTLIGDGSITLPSPNTPIVRTDLDDGNVQLTGTSGAYDEVDVYVDGILVGSATADELGQWAINTEIDRSGQHEIWLSTKLDNGDTYESSRFPFDVDLERVTDGNSISGVGSAVEYLPSRSEAGVAGAAPLTPPTIDTARQGATVELGALALAGAGVAGRNVIVYQNGNRLGEATVNANGRWTLNTRLADPGSYRFRVTDSVQTGLASDTLRLSVAAPIEAPTLSIERDGRDRILPLVGTGEPGTTLLIALNGNNIRRVVVGEDGTWSTEVTRSDTISDYEFVAKMVDDENRVVATSFADRISFSRIALAPTTEAEAEPEVEAEPEPEPEPEPIAADIALAIPEIDLSALTIDVNGNIGGELPIAGKGAPVGARVMLYLDGVELGETTINSDGTYNYPHTWNLAPGTYQLTAAILGDDGSELANSNVAEIVIPEPQTSLRVVYATGADRAIADAPAVELIFDASWSMTLPPNSDAEEDRLTADDPGSRIAIARDSMLRVVEELPTGIPVALRVFGNKAAPLECQTDLEVALAPLDNGAMASAIEAIDPQFNAMTPIGTSLNNVVLDVDATDRPVKVVLLTDGQENCGVDPNSAIAGLRSLGIDVIVDIVGFAISDDALKERFQAWALTGGGEYYDASDSDSLVAALDTSIRPKYSVLNSAGELVATGTIGGRALQLEPGDYVVEILNGQDETYDVTVGVAPALVEIE